MSSTEEALLDLKPLDEILESTPQIGWSDLIPVLQKIQNAYGCLPEGVLTELSERSDFSLSRIYGVATFYEQFYLKPKGLHTIRCCRGTACHVRGGPNIASAIEEVLGVGPGQTTEDMKFTFETAACLGVCALAPVVVIDGTYQGQMTPSRLKTVLADFRTGRKEAD